MKNTCPAMESCCSKVRDLSLQHYSKLTLWQMFSYELCKFLSNIFFTEDFWLNVFGYYSLIWITPYLLLYLSISVCLHDILGNEKGSDLPLIRWEFCGAKDFLPIPFMGVPYISVGKQVFQCHQGNPLISYFKAYTIVARNKWTTYIYILQSSEAFVRRCSAKRVFLNVSQNSHESCTWASF